MFQKKERMGSKEEIFEIAKIFKLWLLRFNMDKVVKLKEKTIVEIERFRTHPRETWDDIINLIIKKCKSKKQ